MIRSAGKCKTSSVLLPGLWLAAAMALAIMQASRVKPSRAVVPGNPIKQENSSLNSMTTLPKGLKAKTDDEGHTQRFITIHQVTLSHPFTVERESWQQSGVHLAT